MWERVQTYLRYHSTLKDMQRDNSTTLYFQCFVDFFCFYLNSITHLVFFGFFLRFFLEIVDFNWLQLSICASMLKFCILGLSFFLILFSRYDDDVRLAITPRWKSTLVCAERNRSDNIFVFSMKSSACRYGFFTTSLWCYLHCP